MNSSFTFVTPPQVIVQWGAATDGTLAGLVAQSGSRALIVAGRSLRASGMMAEILSGLHRVRVETVLHEGVPPEPSVTDMQSAMDAARLGKVDVVVAIGGGSVLDVGKGAAALSGFEHRAHDYFAGHFPVPDLGGLPLIAVPTTAGTGSEATWVSVLAEKGHGHPPRKASIRGAAMMPSIALLDARLTVTCPAKVTAQSGMDAWVQAVEAYTSRGANDLTDALAFDAAVRIAGALPTAYAAPDNRDARETLLLSSYMAGMALNTARLGLVHGLAHPLGAVTGAAHGLLCGLLMPPVMRFNRDSAGPKYDNLAAALGLGDRDGLIAFTGELLRKLHIPTHLSDVGFATESLDLVAKESLGSGSTKANARTVSEDDARAVIQACL